MTTMELNAMRGELYIVSRFRIKHVKKKSNSSLVVFDRFISFAA
jgi:hypothetical protein